MAVRSARLSVVVLVLACAPLLAAVESGTPPAADPQQQEAKRQAETKALADEQRGDHRALDALGEAWLADPPQHGEDDWIIAPGGTPNSSRRTMRQDGFGVLGWWVGRPTAQRWQRLSAVLAGPVDAPAFIAIVPSLGLKFEDRLPPGTKPGVQRAALAVPLAVLGLLDQRSLPAVLRNVDVRSGKRLGMLAVRSRIVGGMLAEDVRVCDVVAANARSIWLVPPRSRPDGSPTRGSYPLGGSLDERDATLVDVFDELLPEAIAQLDGARIPVPESWRKMAGPAAAATAAAGPGAGSPARPAGTATAPAEARPVAESGAAPTSPPKPAASTSPGAGALTADELAAVRAVVAEAVAKGFPDPARSAVLDGSLDIKGQDGGFTWVSGVFLRDGTAWYADGYRQVEPFGDKQDQMKPYAPPSRGMVDSAVTGPWLKREPVDAQAAIRVPAGRGLARGWSADPAREWPALQGWIALPWWAQGSDPAGEALVAAALWVTRDLVVPGTDWRAGNTRVERGVRRIIAEWFAGQVATGGDAARRAKAREAALTILDRADRAAYMVRLDRLAARRLVAPQVDPSSPFSAPLAVRLAVDEVSRIESAAISDGELLTMVGSTAVASPLPAGRVTLVGDVACDLLGRRWGMDPRWLVLGEPVIAAALGGDPAAALAANAVPWEATAWTDTVRATAASAVVAWAAAHRDPLDRRRELVRRGPAAQVVAGAAEQPPGVLPEALAARLADGGDPAALEPALLLAIAEDPAGPRLAAALAAIGGPLGERLRTLAAQLSAPDPAAITARLAQDARRGLARDSGLLAHSGRVAALERLRACAAGSGADADAVLQQVGLGAWPVAGQVAVGARTVMRDERALAIPVALALDGLRDRRIPSRELAMREQLLMANPGLRICDLVALRVIRQPRQLALDQDSFDSGDFLRRGPAERDEMITYLAARLEPVARELAAVAGWPPTALAAPR